MTFDSKTFFDALFSFAYVKGAFISLSLATCCQILAIAIGFALALARTGNHKFASAAAGLYIWFFRAIPALLLLMLFWFSLPEMLPLFRS